MPIVNYITQSVSDRLFLLNDRGAQLVDRAKSQLGAKNRSETLSSILVQYDRLRQSLRLIAVIKRVVKNGDRILLKRNGKIYDVTREVLRVTVGRP